jgi:hypothetical protein
MFVQVAQDTYGVALPLPIRLLPTPPQPIQLLPTPPLPIVCHPGAAVCHPGAALPATPVAAMAAQSESTMTDAHAGLGQ